MRLTDEMVERDDARYAGRNGLAEIKYLGREVEHRKAITNDDIRFMAWAFRFADAIIEGQRNKIENLMETIERQAEIERLKAHEAKLLTFDEVKKHYSIPDELTGNLMESIDYSYDIAPLYMECPDEDQWVVHWRDYRSIEPFLEGWQKDYGKTWRCWTKKPTAEQRSAAKWN